MRRSDIAQPLHQYLVPADGHPNVAEMMPPPAPRGPDPSWAGSAALIQEAERAVTDLKAYMAAWDYPEMITRSLARREAVSSSQIENTRTTLPQLLDYEATRSMDGVPSDAPTTERYVVALQAGLDDVRAKGRQALDLTLINRLHAILMEFEGAHAQPGGYRKVQAYIGTGRIEDATFVPCPPGAIADAMKEFERETLHYAPKDEDQFALPLVVQVAIAHAQFETIHPYMDGNGRTGRILMPLIMASEGLPAIYVSGPLLARRQAYYNALKQVQLRGNWGPWISLLCRVVIEACAQARALAQDLDAIVLKWRLHGGLRRNSAAWRLTPYLIGNPSVTANKVAELLKVSHRSALSGLYQLENIGAVRKVEANGREQLFRATDIIARLNMP